MHSGNLLWSKSLSHFFISINFGVRNQKMTSFTLCNFSSRWNNSALYENFGDPLKHLERLFVTYKIEIYLKILCKYISWKNKDVKI